MEIDRFYEPCANCRQSSWYDDGKSEYSIGRIGRVLDPRWFGSAERKTRVLRNLAIPDFSVTADAGSYKFHKAMSHCSPSGNID